MSREGNQWTWWGSALQAGRVGHRGVEGLGRGEGGTGGGVEKRRVRGGRGHKQAT